MTIILDPEMLEHVIREGMVRMFLYAKIIKDPKKAEIKVYRKGTKIAAKIILK